MGRQTPSAAEVRQALGKVLASPGFVGAGRLGSFLQFLVDRTLQGDSAGIKESVLGVEVFGRPADYDPRTDPIVRVEARRLRTRLGEYYSGPGQNEPVRIHIPKGTYVPSYEYRDMQKWDFPWRRAGLGLLVLLGVLSAWWFWPKKRPTGEAPRIVVLPFRNLSADAANEYFSDGLTEELIDALTHVEGLRVAARSASFQYKGKTVDPRTLGADAVVEGSVRKQGDRLRVTVQLVDTPTAEPRWSQSFDRELKDVFAVQQEIAEAVVASLRRQFRLPAGTTIPRRYQGSVAAYEAYLKARYHGNFGTREGFHRAAVYAEEAIRTDERFAPAWALNSFLHGLMGYLGMEDRTLAWRTARQSAERAIALDDSLAEAHAALGLQLGMQEWKPKEAEGPLRKALALNPQSPEAHAFLAVAGYLPQGRVEEAKAELARAVELDPNNVMAGMAYGYVLIVSGQYADAASQYEKVVAAKDVHPDVWWDYGMALGFAKRYPEAREAFRKSSALRQGPGVRLGGLDLYFSGDEEGARRDLARVERDATAEKLSPVDAARAYAMLGETGKAIEWLERAYGKRDPQLIWIRIDPRLRAVRGEGRFRELCAKAGL
jgi:serine/threonine-protein kinase